MQEEKEPQGGATLRISEIRRRRKMRRIRNTTLIATAVVLLAVYLTGAWRQAFTAAGDMAESFRIAVQPSVGWPVKTGIPEILQLEPLTGGFVELGGEMLAVHSAGGNQLRAIQHGYARPAISVGNKRFCLYNRSGTELRVESRTRTLATRTFEKPILLAEMSPNGSVAVVTDSKQGLAELTVLDPSQKFLYEMILTEDEGLPADIAFAADNRRFAMACLTAENGSLASNIFLLDTRKNEITAEISTQGSHVLQMHWLTQDKLLVLYKGSAAVYKASDGSKLASYSYGGKPLMAASVSGQNAALLFSQPMTDAPARLVVLDPQMQELANTQVPAPAMGVYCTRKAVYVLRENSVAAYSLAGKFQWEKELEAPPLAVLSTKKLLVFTGGEADLLEAPSTK